MVGIRVAVVTTVSITVRRVTRSNPFHKANSSILQQNNNNLVMISVSVVSMVGIRVAVVTTVSITVRSITVVVAVVSISSGLSIGGPLAVVVSMVGIGVAVVAVVSVTVTVAVV